MKTFSYLNCIGKGFFAAVAKGGEEEEGNQENEFISDLLGEDLGEPAENAGDVIDEVAAAQEEEEGGDDEEEPEPDDEGPGSEEGGETEEEPAEPEPTPEVNKPEPEPEPEQKPEEVNQPTEEELQVQREAAFTQLTETFALSEEEANLALTEPEKILPTLGAKIYQKIAQDMMAVQQMQIQNLMQSIPQYMQQHTAHSQQEQQMQDTFFAANPGLTEHKEAVMQVLGQRDANGLNPLVEQAKVALQAQGKEATQENLIATVGNTIGALMGVQAGVKRQVRKPKVPVHKPASPGSPAATPEAFDDLSPEESFIDELLKLD